jgi:hypothetical protein
MRDLVSSLTPPRSFVRSFCFSINAINPAPSAVPPKSSPTPTAVSPSSITGAVALRQAVRALGG